MHTHAFTQTHTPRRDIQIHALQIHLPKPKRVFTLNRSSLSNTHTSTYIHTHASTYIHTHTSTYIHTCTYVHTHLREGSAAALLLLRSAMRVLLSVRAEAVSKSETLRSARGSKRGRPSGEESCRTVNQRLVTKSKGFKYTKYATSTPNTQQVHSIATKILIPNKYTRHPTRTPNTQQAHPIPNKYTARQAVEKRIHCFLCFLLHFLQGRPCKRDHKGACTRHAP